MKHPVEDIKASKSHNLQDTTIVLGVTGSIAAVETVKLSRELIRHGAEIYPVMTRAAQDIIHPHALEFATGKKPVTALTGFVEHVALAGINRPMDILLIAPATANTISKMACGIDDTPVTTFATTAIGSGKKVLVVPAMHHSMYLHPVVKENIRKLEELGVTFLMPRFEENKAKIPAVDTMVSWIIRQRNLMKYPKRADQKVLLIGGACSEPVDDVRALSNTSSGESAVALARTILQQGYIPTFLYGTSSEPVPEFIPTTRFRTLEELERIVEDLHRTEEEFHIVICVAALSDFKPALPVQGKMDSHKKSITLELVRQKKLLSRLRNRFPKATLVAYKLLSSEEETSVSREKLASKGKALLKMENCQIVVANDLRQVKNGASSVLLLKQGTDTEQMFTGTKQELAELVLKTARDLEN